MDYNILIKSINDLIPYVNNSRTHSDEQIHQIASSIKDPKYCDVIVERFEKLTGKKAELINE